MLFILSDFFFFFLAGEADIGIRKRAVIEIDVQLANTKIIWV